MDKPAESQTILPNALSSVELPADVYFIDEFKNGTLVKKHMLNKNRILFGRARDCDMPLDHPSISRYHAALLWAPKNDEEFAAGTNTSSFWYLVDCGSTHGTTINKMKIEAGKTIKVLPNNNVFKFGASTRFFTLGSNETEDGEEDSIDERIDSINKSKLDANDADGCGWGMSMVDSEEMEQDEETSSGAAIRSIILAMKNGSAKIAETANHNSYADNPYKSLQQWFQHEGFDFDYKVEADGDKFKCVIELPVDNQYIPIESSSLSRKKEAVADCCLKCCKILDQASILFSWQRDRHRKEGRKAFEQDTEDPDDMIDETVKGKRKKPDKEETKKAQNVIDTYETLNEKWKVLNDELRQLKVKLATIGLPADVTPVVSGDAIDSLDLYLSTMNQAKYGLNLNQKIEKSNLRMQIKKLDTEQLRLEKLIELAKPIALPSNTVAAPAEKPRPTTTESMTKTSIETEASSSPPSLETKPTPIAEASLAKAKEDNDDGPGVVGANTIITTPTPYKKMRKMAQESIVEAIEKEKQAERQKLLAKQTKMEEEVVAGKTAEWLPPTDQTGDGRTHLNDKFGY